MAFRRCFERDMQQRDARSLFKHFAGRNLGGAKARAGEYDFARIGLGDGDQPGRFTLLAGKSRTRVRMHRGWRSAIWVTGRESGISVVGHILLGHALAMIWPAVMMPSVVAGRAVAFATTSLPECRSAPGLFFDHHPVLPELSFASSPPGCGR